MSDAGFSEWHRCKRWQDKGLSCPFDPLEEQRDSDEPEATFSGSGAKVLAQAVRGESVSRGLGKMGEFLGPILALAVILRGVQQIGGLPIGNVTAAALSEEATTRVLSPKLPKVLGPGKEPAKPFKAPAKVPIKAPVGHQAPAPKGFAGAGFFSNQAAELRRMLKGQ